MARSAGRNAPCPCGSGRKYKQCCLPADEARERAARAAPPTNLLDVSYAADADDAAGELGDEELVELTGKLAAGEVPPAPDVWDRFAAADYEEQIAVFRAALQAGELDSELAFEMLAQIQPEAQVRDELDRFGALIREYATQAPDLYAPDAGYYVSWLLDAALAAGRRDELPAMLEPFARDPVQWMDELLRAADQLLYHGAAAPLVTTLERGWAAVRGLAASEPDAVAHYSELLGELKLFEYLAAHPQAHADDPALQRAVSGYLEADADLFTQNVSALLGTLGRHWQPRDFESAPRSEPRERCLWLLAWEWVGVLWRAHAVPLGRGLLALETLLDYQTDRETKGKSAATLLLPAARRLDRFLGRYLDELSWRVYRAGALVELLPLYLAFLVERHLVDEAAARRAHADLEPLAADFLLELEQELVDPTLRANIRARWATP